LHDLLENVTSYAVTHTVSKIRTILQEENATSYVLTNTVSKIRTFWTPLVHVLLWHCFLDWFQFSWI